MYDETNAKRVVDHIRAEDIVNLARQMIAIPSPNFEAGKLTDLVADRMRELEMEVTTMEVEHPFQHGLQNAPVDRQIERNGSRLSGAKRRSSARLEHFRS